MLVKRRYERRRTTTSTSSKWMHVIWVIINILTEWKWSIQIKFIPRTIQHEFIHALGQFHVQSRPDRDQYVTIMWDNIKQGKEHNFKKHTGSLTYNVPYDPKSFMHYSPWGFAIDSSKPTIVSKVKSKVLSKFLSHNSNQHFTTDV